MASWAISKAVTNWLKDQDERRMCRDFEHMESRFGLQALAEYQGRPPHQHRIVHELTKKARMTVLSHVVRKGLDINVQRSSDGCTCLHLAIWNESTTLVQHLLSLGADDQIRNSHGETAGDLQNLQKPEALVIKTRLQGAKNLEGILQVYRDHCDHFGHCEFAQSLFLLTQRAWNPTSSTANDIVEGCGRAILASDVDAIRVIAAALANHKVPRLLDVFKEAICIGGFTGMDAGVAADVAHSFAKATRKDKDVFNALADAAVHGLRNTETLKVAKLCWAFGSVKHVHPQLLEGVAAELQERVADFTNQSLANIVWAFARLGFSCDTLCSSCSAAIVARAEEFNAQDVANTLWAYAKLRVTDVDVFRAMFNRAQIVSNDVYRHHTMATAQERSANLAQLYFGYQVCLHGCPEALTGLDSTFILGLRNLHEQREDLLSSIGESVVDLDALVADLREFVEDENSAISNVTQAS